MPKQKKIEIANVRSIAIQDSIWKKIGKQAEKAGRSNSNYVRQILVLHLSQTKI